ncbi:MAG: transcription antitermination factor NusB [Lachnospiraceae bacterium]|jgi:N utilization substance protein B|nr:transcription antitermination factor NusB [Lachnospiraceae bacterium]
MNRRELRETIFKLLFRAEFFSAEEMGGQVAFFFDDEENLGALSREGEIKAKLDNILERKAELDRLLGERVEGWDVGRMGKVDLAILRLALYEMLFDEDIPEGVAINEAVELAKKYGQENSRAFVNGVLSKYTVK